MLEVMNDGRARTADRIEAGKWLADRGFGKATLVVSPDVTPELWLQELFSKLSLEELETIEAILRKYRPRESDAITSRGQIPVRQQLSSG
jgi:hypothetical protein